MAVTQSLLHGTSRPREAFIVVALTGLAFLNLWELPQQAAQHGGLAFIGVWLLGLALLALPLLLLELALGRRSRRAPVEGLAFLTREADAPRGWRASAWGLLAASGLALAAVALVAGGHINFLGRALELVDGTVQAATAPAWLLPTGSGALFLLAAGLGLLKEAHRAALLLAGAALALLLLLAAAAGGAGIAGQVYGGGRLDAAGVLAALRLALIGGGSGLGVVWLAGMRLPRDASLGWLGLGLVLAQALLGGVLLLALAPFVAAAQANAAGDAWQVVPGGAVVWLLLLACLLVALLVLVLLAEPLRYFFAEKGLGRLPALVLTYAPAALLAEVVWLAGQARGLWGLEKLLAVLVLLVLLGLSLFGGWAMKISHLRKELNLPSEALYNLWRVAVRLLVPLAVAAALYGLLA